MDLDIDIGNYNLNDILKLFSIPVAFSEEHLKSAKRTVLKMHPDKCALPKEYFLFFTKAYRILYQIYSMRHERAQGYGHVQKYAELIADSESGACSAETLGCESATTGCSARAVADHRAKLAKMSHVEFSEWFNAAFVKYKVPNDDTEDAGYEEWFRGNDDNDNCDDDDCDDRDDCDDATATAVSSGSWNSAQVRELERRRNHIRRNHLALVSSSGIEAAPSATGGARYEDLKRAHTETLIPVSDSDYKGVRQFKSVLELQMFRSSAAASIAPLSNAESAARLEQERVADVEQSTHRAYIMAKQDEVAREMNRRFMREFQTLKY